MRQAPHNTKVESQHTDLNKQTVPNTHFTPMPQVAMYTQVPQGSCVSMLPHDLGVIIKTIEYRRVWLESPVGSLLMWGYKWQFLSVQSLYW